MLLRVGHQGGNLDAAVVTLWVFVVVEGLDVASKIGVGR